MGNRGVLYMLLHFQGTRGGLDGWEGSLICICMAGWGQVEWEIALRLTLPLWKEIDKSLQSIAVLT